MAAIHLLVIKVNHMKNKYFFYSLFRNKLSKISFLTEFRETQKIKLNYFDSILGGSRKKIAKKIIPNVLINKNAYTKASISLKTRSSES